MTRYGGCDVAAAATSSARSKRYLNVSCARSGCGREPQAEGEPTGMPGAPSAADLANRQPDPTPPAHPAPIRSAGRPAEVSFSGHFLRVERATPALRLYGQW